jgi:hypothetical protein
MDETPRTWNRQLSDKAIYRDAAAQTCLNKSHLHKAPKCEADVEGLPTGRVPTRAPHTSRKGASPAARYGTIGTMGTGVAPCRLPLGTLAPLEPHRKRQSSCKAPLSAPGLPCMTVISKLSRLELAYRSHTSTVLGRNA